jgi:hypothetical protein
MVGVELGAWVARKRGAAAAMGDGAGLQCWKQVFGPAPSMCLCLCLWEALMHAAQLPHAHVLRDGARAHTHTHTHMHARMHPRIHTIKQITNQSYLSPPP